MKKCIALILTLVMVSSLLHSFLTTACFELKEGIPQHKTSSYSPHGLQLHTGEYLVSSYNTTRSVSSISLKETTLSEYFLLSGVHSNFQDNDCPNTIKDPMIHYLSNNFSQIWYVDLIGWCLVDFDVHETNATLILEKMYLSSPSNLAFNPIGSSVDSETMYVISLTNQNTTRYTQSLDLTTNLVGLENNPLYPHVYYSITADGGFMMGGTTTDKVILNGTTEGNAVSRRDDRFMTAPPFY